MNSFPQCLSSHCLEHDIRYLLSNLLMPPVTSLKCSVYSFQKLKNVPLWNRLEPPVRRRNVNWLIIFEVNIQKFLLGISLMTVL